MKPGNANAIVFVETSGGLHAEQQFPSVERAFEWIARCRDCGAHIEKISIANGSEKAPARMEVRFSARGKTVRAGRAVA